MAADGHTPTHDTRGIRLPRPRERPECFTPENDNSPTPHAGARIRLTYRVQLRAPDGAGTATDNRVSCNGLLGRLVPGPCAPVTKGTAYETRRRLQAGADFCSTRTPACEPRTSTSPRAAPRSLVPLSRNSDCALGALARTWPIGRGSGRREGTTEPGGPIFTQKLGRSVPSGAQRLQAAGVIGGCDEEVA